MDFEKAVLERRGDTDNAAPISPLDPARNLPPFLFERDRSTDSGEQNALIGLNRGTQHRLVLNTWPEQRRHQEDNADTKRAFMMTLKGSRDFAPNRDGCPIRGRMHAVIRNLSVQYHI